MRSALYLSWTLSALYTVLQCLQVRAEARLTAAALLYCEIFANLPTPLSQMDMTQDSEVMKTTTSNQDFFNFQHLLSITHVRNENVGSVGEPSHPCLDVALVLGRAVWNHDNHEEDQINVKEVYTICVVLLRGCSIESSFKSVLLEDFR